MLFDNVGFSTGNLRDAELHLTRGTLGNNIQVNQAFDANTGQVGTGTPAFSYFVQDHLGSVVLVTDAAGAITNRLSYDAWGHRRFPNGADDFGNTITSATTRGFTDQEMVGQTGIVNLNARLYDPQLGRMLGADETTANIYDSQTLNLYTYCANNPLSLTDITGSSWISTFFQHNHLLKAALTIAVAAFTGWGVLYALAPSGVSFAAVVAGSVHFTPTALAVAGASGGAASGIINTGTLKG